jgi:transcription elongation factor Elf1
MSPRNKTMLLCCPHCSSHPTVPIEDVVNEKGNVVCDYCGEEFGVDVWDVLQDLLETTDD